MLKLLYIFYVHVFVGFYVFQDCCLCLYGLMFMSVVYVYNLLFYGLLGFCVILLCKPFCLLFSSCLCLWFAVVLCMSLVMHYVFHSFSMFMFFVFYFHAVSWLPFMLFLVSRLFLLMLFIICYVITHGCVHELSSCLYLFCIYSC